MRKPPKTDEKPQNYIFYSIFDAGKFRAVRDISVAPIDASDQAQIIKMMDDEDGYLLVRKRRKGAGGGPFGHQGAATTLAGMISKERSVSLRPISPR